MRTCVLGLTVVPLAMLAACRATPTALAPETATSPTSVSPPASSTPQPTATSTGLASGEAVATEQAVAALAAMVNGEPIFLADFQQQAFDTQRYYVDQGLDPNTEEGQRRLLALRRQVLEDMINQKLIEQAAAELGVTVSNEEVLQRLQSDIDEAGGQAQFEESLAQAGTSREEVQAMERAALIGQRVLELVTGDIPTTAEFVHARHILCETEAACQAALTRIEAGEPFEDVAREVSVDAGSAERGGDLDWVGRGMLPSQEVEDALFALQPGERSGVIHTDFGYHIIEVLERDPEHPLTEEQRYQLREKRLLDWLAERRARSKVEIYLEGLEPTAAPPTTTP